MVQILIDTNIFWEKNICKQLSQKVIEGSIQVYIPAIVHAERIRQLADKYGQNFSMVIIHDYLAAYDFKVLSFEQRDAEALSTLWLDLKQQFNCDQQYWEANRFDIFLCAIARARNLTYVTNDKGNHFDLIETLPLDNLEQL